MQDIPTILATIGLEEADRFLTKYCVVFLFAIVAIFGITLLVQAKKKPMKLAFGFLTVLGLTSVFYTGRDLPGVEPHRGSLLDAAEEVIVHPEDRENGKQQTPRRKVILTPIER